VGIAGLGGVRIHAGRTSCPALAEQVPRLVQGDFEVAQPPGVTRAQALADARTLQPVFFLHEPADALD
jgi:precorrin-4 methylase